MAEPDNESQPELVTDKTVELLLRGAKALVVVVYVVVIITFAMLALGFFLLLAGASREASFVDWVYRNTERAMQPFRGMFPVQDIDGQSVFDASLLFAATLYGFIAIGLHATVVYLTQKARRRHRHHLLIPPSSSKQVLLSDQPTDTPTTGSGQKTQPSPESPNAAHEVSGPAP